MAIGLRFNLSTDRFASGLGLIGVGAFAVAPTWLAPFLGWAFIGAGLLVFLSGASVENGHLTAPPPKTFGQRIKLVWPQILMFACAAGFLVGLIAFIQRGAPPAPGEKLPGVAIVTGINIQDVTAFRRKYVFAFSTPEGARASFYLSPNDVFIFTVTDISGEPHILEIPLGKDGIPFVKFMYLICEAGSGSNYSFLSARVNGKEVRRIDLPARIDLGSRQWKTTLGANEDGRNNGSFLLLELGIWAVTFTNEEIEQLTQNARDFYKF